MITFLVMQIFVIIIFLIVCTIKIKNIEDNNREMLMVVMSICSILLCMTFAISVGMTFATNPSVVIARKQLDYYFSTSQPATLTNIDINKKTNNLILSLDIYENIKIIEVDLDDISNITCVDSYMIFKLKDNTIVRYKTTKFLISKWKISLKSKINLSNFSLP